MYLNSLEKEGVSGIYNYNMCAQQGFFFAKRAEKVGNIAKRNAAVRESTMGLNPFKRNFE